MLPHAHLLQATIADEAGTHSYYYQGHLTRRETMQQARLAWNILCQPLEATAIATADRLSNQVRLFP